ncbi:hypothetical protein JZ751_028751 [Albula glossodonta]|uniref:Zinc finger E-box-binding homeobox 1 n=1 Tax=Albula glossodonta TaxID=121402 RepID=A0A8T2NAU8_9TELE|nr:hypothetical protein JZ751_028751 [Albula glossodonta]
MGRDEVVAACGIGERKRERMRKKERQIADVRKLWLLLITLRLFDVGSSVAETQPLVSVTARQMDDVGAGGEGRWHGLKDECGSDGDEERSTDAMVEEMLQQGDTAVIYPEAPEDEPRQGTPEASGHDENVIVFKSEFPSRPHVNPLQLFAVSLTLIGRLLHWIVIGKLVVIGLSKNKRVDCIHTGRICCLPQRYVVLTARGTPDAFSQLLTCPYCARGYKRYTSLKEHIKYRHEKSEDNFSCSLCSYTFAYRTQLDRHMSAHKTGRDQVPQTPDHCYDITAAEGQSGVRGQGSGVRGHKPPLLNRHRSAHVTQTGGNRKFKCTECGKAFKYKHHLKEHLRIHSGEKPYECSNCKKRFSHSGSYSSHISSKKCIGLAPVNGRPRPGAKAPQCPSPSLPSPPSTPARVQLREKMEHGKPLQEQLPLNQIKSEPMEYEYKPVVVAPGVNGVFNGGSTLQAVTSPQGVVQAVVLPTVGLVSPISINLSDIQNVLKVAVDGNVLRQVLENAHLNATASKEPGAGGGGGGGVTVAVAGGQAQPGSHQSVISTISLPVVDQDGTTKIIINYSLDATQAQLASTGLKKEVTTGVNTEVCKTEKLPEDLTVKTDKSKKADQEVKAGAGKDDGTCLLCEDCPGGLDALHQLKHCKKEALRVNGADAERAELLISSLLSDANLPPSQPPLKNLLSLLKAYYALNAEPNRDELAKISDSVNLPLDVVKKWFEKMQAGQVLVEAPSPSFEPETEHAGSPRLDGKDVQESPATQFGSRAPSAEPAVNGPESTPPSPSPLNLSAGGLVLKSEKDTEEPLDLSLPKLPREESDRASGGSVYQNSVYSVQEEPLNLTCIKKEPLPNGTADASPNSNPLYTTPPTSANPINIVTTQLPTIVAITGQSSVPCLRALTGNKQTILIPQLAYTYATSGGSPPGPEMALKPTQANGNNQQPLLREAGDERPDVLAWICVQVTVVVHDVRPTPSELSPQTAPASQHQARYPITLAIVPDGNELLRSGGWVWGGERTNSNSSNPHPCSHSMAVPREGEAEGPIPPAADMRDFQPANGACVMRGIWGFGLALERHLAHAQSQEDCHVYTLTELRVYFPGELKKGGRREGEEERQDTSSEGVSTVEDQNDSDSAPPRKKARKLEKGMYACDLCDKIFQKSSSLLRHKYEHTVVCCKDCVQVLVHSACLQEAFCYCGDAWQRVGISGKRPHECGICSKAFKHKHHLIEHMRLHSGEKPYQCDKCGRRFSHSGSYSQHMNHRYSYCKKEAQERQEGGGEPEAQDGMLPPVEEQSDSRAASPPSHLDSDDRESSTREDEESEEEEEEEEVEGSSLNEEDIQVVRIGEEGEREESGDEGEGEEPAQEEEEEGEEPMQEEEEQEQEEEEEVREAEAQGEEEANIKTTEVQEASGEVGEEEVQREEEPMETVDSVTEEQREKKEVKEDEDKSITEHDHKEDGGATTYIYPTVHQLSCSVTAVKQPEKLKQADRLQGTQSIRAEVSLLCNETGTILLIVNPPSLGNTTARNAPPPGASGHSQY